MVKETTKAPEKPTDSSEQHALEQDSSEHVSGEQASLEKIRWSLRQRLCEHMRHLNTDLFDELDDFLFCSVQPEELGEGSAQLRLIRELRNKKQLFEEQFLASIDGALQSTLVPKEETAANIVREQDRTNRSAYEKMEVDLALERMQRKAFKHYANRIRQLGTSDKNGEEAQADQVIPENRDILIKNSLRALAASHDVFRISLEHRLVFLKLFEKHFLLQMDRLYQDVISIINNKDNKEFVERLYSSSTSIRKRREKSMLSQQVVAANERSQNEPLSGSKKITARIDELIDAWCQDFNVPEFLESMLRNDWHGVMLLIGLNKGVETREWHEAKETIDLMLQLIAGNSSTGEKSLSFEDLRQRLQQGFELAQMAEVEQRHFFTAMEKLVRHTAGPGHKGERTSLTASSEAVGTIKAKSSKYAAVSEAGSKILDNSDLDDFVALLSDDQEQAIAELDEEAISMDYYLNMVDTMADGSMADVKNAGVEGKCRIRKSGSIADSYQVLDDRGRVLLTRGRVGLAVSLRAGEIRLEGQQDFKQVQPGNSQLLLAEQSVDGRQATTH